MQNKRIRHEIKSHLGLFSIHPFNCSLLRVQLRAKGLSDYMCQAVLVSLNDFHLRAGHLATATKEIVILKTTLTVRVHSMIKLLSNPVN